MVISKGRAKISLNTLFLQISFRESYMCITHIIAVVRAQQKHKGMFLKPGRGQKFSYSVMGWGGGIFFAYRFCQPPPLSPPPLSPSSRPLNNERSPNPKTSCWNSIYFYPSSLSVSSYSFILEKST